VFRGYGGYFENGEWTVYFGGRRVLIPLRRESAWLDWDLALSLLGHDSDLTNFCTYLLNWARPRVVFDVGANYGQFSIRWLVHGVRTISFEPNPACHPYLDMLSQRNGVRSEIVPVALGEWGGATTLSFSPGEEWLGTTSGGGGKFVEHIEVPQRTLDGYVEEHNLKPDLLKIDAEGGDLGVLQGGSRTLIKYRPLVVFESLEPSDRSEFHRLLKTTEYVVCALPLANRGPQSLDVDQFRASIHSNFLGCPVEMIKTWPPQF
jgi:FkbM family methyltransferase